MAGSRRDVQDHRHDQLIIGDILMPNEPRATIDFESRSACSLKKCGTWRYSIDPTTEILCMAFRLPHWEQGRTGLWHPSFPNLDIPESSTYGTNWADLRELVYWIQDGGLVEAHGIWFEFCIWNNICIPQFSFPIVKLAQWRCSAAKAATHAAPRGLEEATKAFRLPVLTDIEGWKAMKKMTKPRKSWKREREEWARTGTTPPSILWHEGWELLESVWRYCRIDVLSEEALSHSLEDLSANEQALFQMDLMINERGFQLDSSAVQTALSLISQETRKLNAQLAVLTDGQVTKATQRDMMLLWLESEGCRLFDTQKESLDEAVRLEKDQQGTRLTERALTAIRIMREVGRSSNAKYAAMQAWMAGDGRVRGGLLYHGATTGRWSGKGIQPHNFPKGTKDSKDQEALWATLKRKKAVISGMTGKALAPLDALSQGLRGTIIAAPGKRLYVADYASIEARVLLWLAGDDDHLDLFRSGADIYCDMAESVYHRSITKDDPIERGMGKIAVLGLGYQMGASKFVDTCAKFGIIIEEDFALEVVTAYRAKYWRVKNLWNDTEAAAIEATQHTGTRVRCGYVSYLRVGRFLYCILPSGRRLSYPFPEVRQKETPWGEKRPSLTFMGVDSYTHQWQRQTTYGGMLVENYVQAVARDLMAEGMLRCEAGDTYRIVLSVHDELVAEADLMAGNVQEFESLMSQNPPWAPGCPIVAEGWTGTRYRK